MSCKMCKHSWIVYSTALCPPTIMVYCKKCDADGRVTDFSDDEWNEAFWAPNDNYLWDDSKRVVNNSKRVKKK